MLKSLGNLFAVDAPYRDAVRVLVLKFLMQEFTMYSTYVYKKIAVDFKVKIREYL